MTIQGRLGAGAVLTVVCLVAGTGCSNAKYDDERATLLSENSALKQQVDADKAALARAAKIQSTLEAKLNQDAIDKAAASHPVTDENGVTTGGKNAKGEDLIQIESDVLFDSGQDKLKATAVKALEKVAGILDSQYAGQTIRIEGYTDDVKVRANSVWQDNWDLGANRARQVLLYLEKKGIARDKMYIASFADTQPKDPPPSPRPA